MDTPVLAYVTSGQPPKESTVPLPDLPWPLLQDVAALADAPLTQIAERLRDAIRPYLGSSSLVIFTEDCTGRPQKKAGEEDITSRVSIAELIPRQATFARLMVAAR